VQYDQLWEQSSDAAWFHFTISCCLSNRSHGDGLYEDLFPPTSARMCTSLLHTTTRRFRLCWIRQYTLGRGHHHHTEVMGPSRFQGTDCSNCSMIPHSHMALFKWNVARLRQLSRLRCWSCAFELQSMAGGCINESEGRLVYSYRAHTIAATLYSTVGRRDRPVVSRQ